ncbi:unnamed protein product [Strongylus vulgaris]|uniref:Uncharacterized protein n=1 Tax=Strongylus vulgaris TaxID=40348 RepID=A0A3P7JTZ6_STRVU|nr:unnamed protein product [Strongylus vulgaris]
MVHPQPHKSPSPEPSLAKVKEAMKDDAGTAACTILSIEPEGATRDIEQELFLSEPPLFGVSSLNSAKIMEVPALTAPRAPPRPSRDRTSSVNYLKGQVARSQPVPTSTFSSTVVEFVHDVTLQHQSQAQMVEKVEWVELHSIEKGLK